MKQFNASFREAWFTDTGGVRVQGGDKLLYKTDIPASQCARDNIFPVWIEANIKKTEDDKVWLDMVEIVNGFKNDEETEMVIDRAEEITNKFQKAIRLTRNEDWFVFPPGKEMDLSQQIWLSPPNTRPGLPSADYPHSKHSFPAPAVHS